MRDLRRVCAVRTVVDRLRRRIVSAAEPEDITFAQASVLGRQNRTEWLAAQLQERCTEEERQTVIAAMAVLERPTHD